ncbi:MAG: sugar phosphate isomerase/epimerase [Anaerolineae bacterium]|nr:sugar phosphate isomerase/epimerase [Anaerolineae bacterium]
MVTQESIAVQLYSVREDLAQDFDGTMRRVAAMGYSNVETAGFTITTKQAKATFDSLNITVVAAHLPLPLGDMKNNVLDTIGIYGCEYLVCAYLSADDYFQSVDAVKRAADLLNEANVVAQANNLTLLYHNHWWESALLDGKPAYQYLADYTEDTVGFEIDTYWVQTGGLNPVDVIQELGSRVPILHLKDGAATTEAAMVALGDGVMDFDAIFAASQANWHIVELDRCDSDMLQAVAKSYQYLMGKIDS